MSTYDTAAASLLARNGFRNVLLLRQGTHDSLRNRIRVGHRVGVTERMLTRELIARDVAPRDVVAKVSREEASRNTPGWIREDEGRRSVVHRGR